MLVRDLSSHRLLFKVGMKRRGNNKPQLRGRPGHKIALFAHTPTPLSSAFPLLIVVFGKADRILTLILRCILFERTSRYGKKKKLHGLGFPLQINLEGGGAWNETCKPGYPRRSRKIVSTEGIKEFPCTPPPSLVHGGVLAVQNLPGRGS